MVLSLLMKFSEVFTFGFFLANYGLAITVGRKTERFAKYREVGEGDVVGVGKDGSQGDHPRQDEGPRQRDGQGGSSRLRFGFHHGRHHTDVASP